jgi:hypothetical protein
MLYGDWDGECHEKDEWFNDEYESDSSRGVACRKAVDQYVALIRARRQTKHATRRAKRSRRWRSTLSRVKAARDDALELDVSPCL